MPRSTAADEVAQLKRRVEELTASHLRLRVRCARQACQRRETVDGLRAMMGCVQAALDDVACDAAGAVPQLIVNVLEYVLRQCSRSLFAVNGSVEDSPAVASLLSSSARSVNSEPCSAVSPRSNSPGETARRDPATPGIILHRLRDRVYQ